jgi:hypothetical protein
MRGGVTPSTGAAVELTLSTTVVSRRAVAHVQRADRHRDRRPDLLLRLRRQRL